MKSEKKNPRGPTHQQPAQQTTCQRRLVPPDARLCQFQRPKPAGIMSNTSPIGEVLANISKQVVEMNGKIGGMEERLVRVENENRRNAIQPEYDEIRRASVHSTTLASVQADNLCSPPQSQTRSYQRPTFQTPNPPNHLRQPTPHPNPQHYHLP
ncbi:hypothetical protein H5410_030618 [Solanum commersonii]|uniref:Uncharacterized protein n=1 Tax=Solanum commersonii TaxID=4109 RepID=A0A9J5YHW6_SOLCO|nr:hypothetical protein H5410_030618 [Solanum commersonii]